MRPRLGIIDFNPIQYRTPLYQRLARRGNVQVSVLFLSDHGYKERVDPGFGVPVSWDIDLLSGYPHEFLVGEGPNRLSRQLTTLVRWLRQHDAVVIYGYVKPWMLCAMAACRSLRIPYILRGESHARGQGAGMRRHLRDVVAYAAVSLSSGALAIGQLNEEFYRKYGGGRRITFAPYSVDDSRFAQAPQVGRSELLARWGLNASRPVIMFCGKLIPRKRPLDLAAAVQRLPDDVTTVFVGDGSIAENVRAALKPGSGAVTGFVNQSELPSYFHAADILVLPSDAEPWGLVVNEAMAAGALPVTSDRVGAAPDLVSGIGEVYPCGDVGGLAEALRRALEKVAMPETRDQVRRHAARYSLDVTAAGFEAATLAVATGSS
jgi:glycosyltransferase involved in cell wall biosynthesis